MQTHLTDEKMGQLKLAMLALKVTKKIDHTAIKPLTSLHI